MEECDVGECEIEWDDAKPTNYAWFVLFCLTYIRAIHRLHRQVIGFVYGY